MYTLKVIIEKDITIKKENPSKYQARWISYYDIPTSIVECEPTWWFMEENDHVIAYTEDFIDWLKEK